MKTSTTTSNFSKVLVRRNQLTLGYYTDIPVSIGDRVVAETKFGIFSGNIVEIHPAEGNPFIEGRAKCRILENVTTKQVNKECEIMSTAKLVTVTHASGRTNAVCAESSVKLHDLVVFDSPNGLHVGEVTEDNGDVAAVTSKSFWVVDVVDLSAHKTRKDNIEKAARIKKQLDAKLKNFNELKMLEMLASTDQEAAVLLGQYKELTGGI